MREGVGVPEPTGPDEAALLAEAAVALYAVAPAAFTAARTAAARDARQAQDRVLATAVGALRKPSAAAAAVNLLVRERPEDLGRLLDLGVRLREAQAALAGADLRALHAEQQRTVAEVADAAVGLLTGAGGSAGTAVRGQVEGTLRAAMGDPDAAGAVATGLLTRDLFSSGFEPVDVDGAVAVPGAPALTGAPVRRTPLRAVPEPEPDGPQDGARAGRRRRGRLLTSEEPSQPLHAAEAPAPRRRGRVVTSEEADEAPPPPAGRRPRAGTAQDRARTERARRDEQEQAARERRAEQERADRERRREAARRSADQDVALAREEADRRATERDAADRRLAGAESRSAELGEVVERAQEEIARLRAALADAEREAREVGLEVRHARSARTTASKAAERAAGRLRDAEAARERL